MTRAMLLGLAAALLLVVGCDAEVAGTDDPYQDDPNDPVVCTGDPDTGMTCKKASEYWDCTAMPNGDVKCTHESPQTPGGASTWTCKVEGSKIICTTPDQDATPGGDGTWDCVSDDSGTTCTKDLPQPPGDGDWSCILDEFTLTCTASDGTVPPPPSTTTPPSTPPPGSVPPGSGTQDCYEAPEGTTTPGTPPTGAWAMVVTKKVQYQGQTALYVRVTFNKMFVDNTYGQYSTPYHNPTGKPIGHTFDQLEESDKAEIYFNNSKGNLVMHAVVDYISASSSAPSGYACLGVTGGEGSMTVGSASDVLAARSSLHVNLNELGHVLTVDSPPTDPADPYTPLDPKYANWIYDVWYEVWVKWSAFGADGPGKVYITGIHASPSRVGANSFEIEPAPCP